MAKIPLRAYNREIENLIDSGHTEEAIAHCRHILKVFPKHVETYRLLGKAFLETQRYSDASDILQRVLSSTPDDFVSHVGMSIIREDEGNLDQAIWHMERAFEIQPANGAIQEELRRLYGRRDGFEPPRVRLTHGALARMYVRGELYQQAIAELRPALADDPQRIDLQVLLSEAYAKSGLRAEAADTASAILKKLPHCSGALWILSNILAGTERGEDTQVYRHRLGMLDPYVLHTGPQASTPERVPEVAVTLERLEWKPGQAEPGQGEQPEWAASLGIKMDNESDKDSFPDWMNVNTQPEESEEDAWSAAVARGTGMLRMDRRGDQENNRDAEDVDETPDWIANAATPAERTPEDQIPGWMKEVGWGPSTGQFEEDAQTFDVGEETPDEGGIFNADMPDWLREMAPGLTNQPEKTPESAAEEDFDWMTPPAPEQAAGDQASGGDPDWMDDSAAQASPTGVPEEDDWMAELGEAEPEQPAPAGETDIPDWLKEFSIEESAGAPSEDDRPDWLSDLTSPVDETQAIPSPMAETIPSWLHGLGEEELEELPVDEEPSQAETVPSWLQGLGEEEQDEQPVEAEEATLETASAEIPDWLTEPGEPVLGEAEPAELPDWMVELGATELAAAEEDEIEPAEIPDWMADLGLPEQDLSAPEAAQPAELPDWMADLAPEYDELAPESAAPAGDDQTEADHPDWMPEMPALETDGAELVPGEEIALQPEDAEIPAWLLEEEPPSLEDTQPGRKLVDDEATPQAQPDEVMDLEDSDAAFAWMESLAIKQGASEALLLSPEERSDKAAEWEAEHPSELPVDPAPEPAEMELDGEELAHLDEPEPAPSAAEDLPAWLQETMPVSLAELEAAAEELKDDEHPEQSQPASEAVQDDTDAAFAWMESLAIKQGASEALLLSPEERSEKPPDWVEDLALSPEAEQPSLEAPAEETLISEIPASADDAAADQPALTGELEEEDPGWFLPEDAQAIEEAAELNSASLSELDEQAAASIPELNAMPDDPGFDLPDWMMDEEQPLALDETQPVALPSESAEPELVSQTEPEEPETNEELASPVHPSRELDTNDMDAAFAWLESLAVKQGAHEALLLEPEDRRETAPDWVEGMVQEAELSAHQADRAEDMADETETTGSVEELPPQEVAADAPTLVARPEGLDEELAAADIPDWLLEEEQAAPPAAGDTKPVRKAEPESEPPPDQPAEIDNMEDAFAWLESLAVKQGASEALLVKPDDRRENPPDWVTDIEDTPLELSPLDEEQAAAPEIAAAEERAAAEVIDAGQPEAAPRVDSEILSAQTADWQDHREAEEQIYKHSPQAADEFVAETAEQSDLTGWLDEAALASAEDLPASEAAVIPELPDLPDWLAGVESADNLDWTPPAIHEKLVRKLDLNMASLAELERLPGVGFRLAQAIVNYRESYGAFKKVNDLFDVRGFSQATMDFIQERVFVEPPPEPAAPSADARTSGAGMLASDLPDFEGEAPAELVKARDALLNDSVEESVTHYDQLIRARQNLPNIVSDLQSAVQRMPNEVLLWQALGDAHMRLDHLQEALNAYLKAEDLLR